MDICDDLMGYLQCTIVINECMYNVYTYVHYTLCVHCTHL